MQEEQPTNQSNTAFGLAGDCLWVTPQVSWGQSVTAFGSAGDCLWVSPLLSTSQSNTAFGLAGDCLWVTPRVSEGQSSTAFGSVGDCLWVTSPLSISQSTTAFGLAGDCLWGSSRVSGGQSSTEYKSVRGYFSAPGWRHPHTIVTPGKGGGDAGAGGLKFSDSLFLISYYLFSENVEYRIRNQKSGSFIPALKGQVISAQGNALGWKGTRTTAPWFSAQNPAANKGYKFQQVGVNLLQGRVSTLQGSRYFQQVRVSTLQGSRYFQQARVSTLQGSRYFQQGTVSAVPASLSDFLFLISYFLFSENVKYRIRNNKSGSFIPALKEQLISAPGNALGWSAYEIQFSKYLASGETVIHRAQAVRACLLPFFTQCLNNN